MNKGDFTYLVEHPQEVKKVQLEELEAIIQNYPYFQTARAIYLKGLQKSESFTYNNQLKVTAAYTSDRRILFEYITQKNEIEKVELSTKEIHEEIVDKVNTQVKKTTPEVIVATDLNIGKPLSFSSNETHSFNEWLQLSAKKPIIRETRKGKKQSLIDKFIQTNPKIIPVDKNAPLETIQLTENSNQASLMTETLAKVYLEQKKFDNAIKAYEILSLKYPEKSGFFADQIKKIRILQKHKS